MTGLTRCGRFRSNGLAAIAAVAATATCGVLATPAAAAPIGDSSAEKQEKLLDLLETFVPRAEAFWCENASPGPHCNTDRQSNDSAGFFDIGPDNGVGQSRGEGAIVYIYSTLLSARPTQASFAGFDREDVIEYHLHQAIRHLAFTHGEAWGGSPAQSGAEHWPCGGHHTTRIGRTQEPVAPVMRSGRQTNRPSCTPSAQTSSSATFSIRCTPRSTSIATWVVRSGSGYGTASEPAVSTASAAMPCS